MTQGAINQINLGDKKSMYATIMILVTMIIVFFVTTSMYSTLVASNEEKSNLQTRMDSLKAELDSLNKKKDEVNKNIEIKNALTSFAGKYREDLIITDIYSPIDGITVKDISMDKGQKMPNGLNMANISINVDAKSVEDMMRYMDYLTSEKSKIRFVIKNIALPLNTENTNSSISAGLSLGMYYYE